LIRRQGCALLDVADEVVEGLLGVRLDQLELRGRVLVGLDVVAVLYFVETVFALLPAVAIPAITVEPVLVVVVPILHRCRDGARIRARVRVDRSGPPIRVKAVSRPGGVGARLPARP
jgi:hypothetical protein